MEQEYLDIDTNYSGHGGFFYPDTLSPSHSEIALAVFTFILLAVIILANGTLLFVVFRHGYCTSVADTLVMNWAVFSTIYAIAYGGFMTAHQRFLRRPWTFSYSACVVTSYLEYYCVLPISLIPVILCTHLFLKAFPSTNKWRKRFESIPSSLWISLAIWASASYCLLGAFYQGSTTHINDDMSRKRFCHMVVDGSNHHVMNGYYAFQLLVTFLLPTPILFTISILTAIHLRNSASYTSSTFSNKIHVERLIFFLTIIYFICHFGGQISLWLREVRFGEHYQKFVTFMPMPYTTSISLAVLGCHVEFWRSLFNRHHLVMSDDCSILPDGNSETQETSSSAPNTNMTDV